MRNLTSGVIVVLVGVISASHSWAVEIAGKVEAIAGGKLTIVSASEYLPRPGDSLEVYFNFPGEGPVRVASGVVDVVAGDRITAKVDKLVGTLAKGQLVRIQSERALRKGGPVPSESSGSLREQPKGKSSGATDDVPPENENAAERSPSRVPPDAGASNNAAATDKPSSGDTVFVFTRDYSGKIYDGTKAIADLTLRVADRSHSVEEVFVNGKGFDRFSGLNETAVGETLAIAGFPVLSALLRPRATSVERLRSHLPIRSEWQAHESGSKIVRHHQDHHGPSHEVRSQSSLPILSSRRPRRFRASNCRARQRRRRTVVHQSGNALEVAAESSASWRQPKASVRF